MGLRNLSGLASVLRSQEMGQRGYKKKKKITSRLWFQDEPEWGLLRDRKTNKETMTATNDSKLYRMKEEVKVRWAIWRQQEGNQEGKLRRWT